MESEFEDDARDFWNRIDDLRGKKKLTEIAEATGINYELMRVQRTRHRIPSLKICVILAKHLGSSVEFLATGKQAPGIYDKVLNAVYGNHLLYSIVEELLRYDSSKLRSLADLLGIANGKAQKNA